MKSPLLALVMFYRRRISPLFPPRCRYYPTCSTYALTCIQRHGAAKGTLLSLWRWLRCNPLSNGGVDYPPLHGEWAAAPYHQMSDAELARHWAALDSGRGGRDEEDFQERGSLRTPRQADRLGKVQATKGI